MKKLISIAVLSTTVSMTAIANGQGGQPDWSGDLSVGTHLGTLGSGINFGYEISDQWVVKAEFNNTNYNYDGTENDIKYDFDLKLKSQGVLVNWHPFSSGFRLTGGIYNNGNHVKGRGVYGSTDTINIGGTVYSGADIGSVTTEVKFNSTAPYLGLGYAANLGAFEFGFDAGVLLQSSADVSLDITPNAGITGAALTKLIIDTKTERKSLENDLDGLKYFPVAKLSVSYNF